MTKDQYPPPGYRYVLDAKKLFDAFEGKRKQDKLSRDRIAARYGVARNTFGYHPTRKSYDTSVLIPMLMYLKKDVKDFLKLVEVNTNGGTQRGNSSNSSES